MKIYLIIILFFGFVHVSHAAFEITEIMYDVEGTDTNREWVEVQNTGSEANDLSKWYLFSDNTKHALVPQGLSQVEPQGFAVITQDVTKFKLDWPNYSGLIFDTSWSGFNNETETIALKDQALNLTSSVTYLSSMGGAGDGNSLQKTGSAWKGAAPTPGTGTSSSTIAEVSDGQQTESTEVVVSKKQKEIDIPRITTEIISKNTVVSGIAFSINALTSGYSKEPLPFGKFVWNFGDGTTDIQPYSKPFEHIYAYPGEYVVTLSYSRYYYIDTVDATDRMTIKVISPDTVISSVGDSINSYVEIENKSQIEVPLSSWILKGKAHSFIVPKDTVILPSNKLRFSPRITHFTGEDMNSVVLLNPSGETVSFYPITTFPLPKVASTKKISSVSEPINDFPQVQSPQVTNLNDLGASANNSSVKESPRSLFMWLGLGGIITIGALSILFIRDRKKDDIHEEEIVANEASSL
jgi:hypothetical protein